MVVELEDELLDGVVLDGVVVVELLPLTVPAPLVVSLPWYCFSVLHPARSAAKAIIRHAFFINHPFVWLSFLVLNRVVVIHCGCKLGHPCVSSIG